MYATMFSLSEFWCWLCASWKSGKERKEWKYFAELMRPINSEDKVLKVCLVLSYDFRLHVRSSSTKQIKLYGPFINISSYSSPMAPIRPTWNCASTGQPSWMASVFVVSPGLYTPQLFQFWDITDMQHSISLRYAVNGLDLHILWSD